MLYTGSSLIQPGSILHMYSWYICKQKEFLSNLVSILLLVYLYIGNFLIKPSFNLTSGIYIYKVVICVCPSVCMFVRLSDYNSGTPGRICLKFWLGNSGEPRECYWLSFEILSWVGRLLSGKIPKIIIYDQVRVNYTTLIQPGFNPTLGILV